MKIKLEKIIVSDRGKCINYKYQIDKGIIKYFSEKLLFAQYDVDISKVPYSILVIPFLANFAPVSWFAGFNIEIEEIDKDFLKSLEEIKLEFAKYHPSILIKTSKIKYTHIVANKYESKGDVMLFSGGVDAYATYFKQHSKILDLVTVKGADIKLKDDKQWNKVVEYNQFEPVLNNNKKHYIESNIRDFYTFEVDKLLEDLSWWGNIQHGLSLISLTAPLSYVNNYRNIFIASTRDRVSNSKIKFWGSMPEIDEKISWNKIKVIHDGIELTRQAKVELIVSSVKKLNQKLRIRVCYSDLKSDLNCSKCEKCLRTIFGIILSGDNPNKYGFKANSTVYNQVEKTIEKGFKTNGTQQFWNEILIKAQNNASFFVFEDREKERVMIQNLLPMINEKCISDIKKATKFRRIKLDLINRYPSLFNKYLYVRRKL